MKQKIYIVALLAGMLALVGCGGGNSSSDDDDTTTTTTNGTTTTAGTPKTLSGTGLTTGDPIRIEAGEKYETPNGGMISCTGSTDCVIEVADQRGTPLVTVTEGTASFAAKAATQAPKSGQTAGVDMNDSDWLSRRNVINAVKLNAQGTAVEGITITDSRGIEHGLKAGSDRDDNTDSSVAAEAALENGGMFDGDGGDHDIHAGSAIGHVTIEDAGGHDTRLRMVHTRGRDFKIEDDNVRDRETTFSDYLVYGTWLIETGADSGPDVQQEARPFAYGSLPWGHTGDNTPLPGAGDARYEGKALGHYKLGSAKEWSEWDGTVSLKANFSGKTAKIEGNIWSREPIQDLTTTTIGDNNVLVGLSAADLGQEGKVSVGDGKWSHAFYGTKINSIPNGVAGSFSTSRAGVAAGTRLTPDGNGGTISRPITAVTAAEVHGAFGAHLVGQNEDADEQEGG